MHSGPREWKSIVADRLHRMGLGDSAREILHGKKRQPAADERMASEWRAEGERRAREREMSKPREEESLLARLRTFFRR